MYGAAHRVSRRLPLPFRSHLAPRIGRSLPGPGSVRSSSHEAPWTPVSAQDMFAGPNHPRNSWFGVHQRTYAADFSRQAPNPVAAQPYTGAFDGSIPFVPPP
jgi:hypothetical protein